MICYYFQFDGRETYVRGAPSPQVVWGAGERASGGQEPFLETSSRCFCTAFARARCKFAYGEVCERFLELQKTFETDILCVFTRCLTGGYCRHRGSLPTGSQGERKITYRQNKTRMVSSAFLAEKTRTPPRIFLWWCFCRWELTKGSLWEAFARRFSADGGFGLLPDGAWTAMRYAGHRCKRRESGKFAIK